MADVVCLYHAMHKAYIVLNTGFCDRCQGVVILFLLLSIMLKVKVKQL